MNSLFHAWALLAPLRKRHMRRRLAERLFMRWGMSKRKAVAAARHIP